MAGSFKGKVDEAREKVTESASKLGHEVGEKMVAAADGATDTAKKAGERLSEAGRKVGEKAKETFGEYAPAGTFADIRGQMDVYASCSTFVGKVDHLEGDLIKLTENDSPDGQHHLIPGRWVGRVDSHVHLKKDSRQVQSEWQPA
jgi:hypothetical protein